MGTHVTCPSKGEARDPKASRAHLEKTLGPENRQDWIPSRGAGKGEEGAGGHQGDHSHKGHSGKHMYACMLSLTASILHMCYLRIWGSLKSGENQK